MTYKNRKSYYGTVGIDPDEFEPYNVKIRITTMLDEDILDALRKMAQQNGTRYQTLLNQILRSFFSSTGPKKQRIMSEEQVRKIVREELKKKRA